MKQNSILMTRLEWDIKNTIPFLKSEDIEDRFWATQVLGEQHFGKIETIPQILEKIEYYYRTEHHWFLMCMRDLNFYIQSAFYNFLYPVDKFNEFFRHVYTEKSIKEALHDRTKTETLFDGVWDMYVKVLSELGYEY